MFCNSSQIMYVKVYAGYQKAFFFCFCFLQNLVLVVRELTKERKDAVHHSKLLL